MANVCFHPLGIIHLCARMPIPQRQLDVRKRVNLNKHTNTLTLYRITENIWHQICGAQAHKMQTLKRRRTMRTGGRISITEKKNDMQKD